jgi:hypothetical protein
MKKLLPVILGFAIFTGCSSAKGIVSAIDQGRDGYTATINTNRQNTVEIVISRVDMGIRYAKVKVGDKIKAFGQKTKFDSVTSIHATFVFVKTAHK